MEKGIELSTQPLLAHSESRACWLQPGGCGDPVGWGGVLGERRQPWRQMARKCQLCRRASKFSAEPDKLVSNCCFKVEKIEIDRGYSRAKLNVLPGSESGESRSARVDLGGSVFLGRVMILLNLLSSKMSKDMGGPGS